MSVVEQKRTFPIYTKAIGVRLFICI